METINKEFLTAAESRSLLGISKAYFYKLKASTKLPTYVVGTKKTLFRKEDLLKLVQLKKPQQTEAS